jgi:exodeoxyribonuclease VII large subunit
MQQPPLDNVPQFSVSELAFSLKKTLESTYGHVRVRGELSRVKVHTSGHMYSTLKNDNESIEADRWRGNLQR